jgi:hypothetical protein
MEDSMRLRTLALVIALGWGLTLGTAAKKRTPHLSAATAKRAKIKRPKSNLKRHKVKGRKVLNARKVKR